MANAGENQEISPVESAVEHGGLDFAELNRLGLSPDSVIDFSSNVNPFGVSPQVREAIQQVRIDLYPDRDAIALRQALSEHLEVSFEQILAGNGSSELLWLIGLAFLRAGDAVLIAGPTYGEYARVSQLMGARCFEVRADAEADFAVPRAAIREALYEHQPRVMFVCRPNNPTGQLVPAASIREWAASQPECLIVVDEAYLEFAAGAESLVGCGLKNVIVLRSMTKAHALAGLRLGYLVADPSVVNACCRVRPPWSVSSVAQAAGVATLQDGAHLRKSLQQLARANATLLTGLRDLGFNPVRSSTHYSLIPVGNACHLREALLAERVVVRDCRSFGLPEYIRVSARSPRDNAVLLKTLKRLEIAAQLVPPVTEPIRERIELKLFPSHTADALLGEC